MSSPIFYDDDRFWSLLEPFLFPPAFWTAAAGEVEGVVKLTGLQFGAVVLDLGCGPGRHTLELARRGYKVTGVDRTERYLAALKASADKEHLPLEIVQSDMRDFVRQEAFDVAVNLYTAFGYFVDIEDDRRVLKNLFDSLKPGGKAVLQMNCKERLARIFQPRGWEEVNGEFKLEERTPHPDWSGIHNRWIHISREGIKTEFIFDLRIYSAVELKTEMLNVGFSKVDIYGGLSGEPFDQNARWLVAVGHRS